MTAGPTKGLADLPHVPVPDDYAFRVGPYLAECYARHGPSFAADWPGYRVIYLPLLQAQIEARQERPTGDILGILVGARDDEGRALTDAQLLGHPNILLVAGHETSTSLSAWLYLLSTHPEYLGQEGRRRAAR